MPLFRFLIGFLFLILSVPSEGFLVVRLNLQQLTSLADQVVVGRCMEVKKGIDKNGRPVQYVTFDVQETLKGDPQEKVTFKQILLEGSRDYGSLTTTTAFSDLPTYEVGEESILFLSSASDIGLTAPIGLTQGRFRILPGRYGEKRVMNGTKNRGLFLGLEKSPTFKTLSLTSREKGLIRKNSEEIRYDEFISLVKKMAAIQ